MSEEIISIHLDRTEYYENEAITGCLKLKVTEKELKNIRIRLGLTYMESYTLFDESG